MKHKVLVVDDDRAIRMLLTDVLTRAGYEISTAKDGRDALKHFELHKPDLIITDLKMPFVDGYELCRTRIFVGPDFGCDRVGRLRRRV